MVSKVCGSLWSVLVFVFVSVDYGSAFFAVVEVCVLVAVLVHWLFAFVVWALHFSCHTLL